MENTITTNSEAGQQIVAFLQEKMGLPEHIKSLTIHMDIDDAITYSGIFYATTPDPDAPRRLQPPIPEP